MCTVVSPPAREVTVRQIGLVPSTAKIIHPYLSGSGTKVGPGPNMCCTTIAQLPTDHVAIADVPVVVTDSAPLAAVVDFNATLVGMSTPDKSYGKVWERYLTGVISYKIVGGLGARLARSATLQEYLSFPYNVITSPTPQPPNFSKSCILQNY